MLYAFKRLSHPPFYAEDETRSAGPDPIPNWTILASVERLLAAAHKNLLLPPQELSKGSSQSQTHNWPQITFFFAKLREFSLVRLPPNKRTCFFAWKLFNWILDRKERQDFNWSIVESPKRNYRLSKSSLFYKIINTDSLTLCCNEKGICGCFSSEERGSFI